MQKLHERENEKPNMETANSRNDCFNVRLNKQKCKKLYNYTMGNAMSNASAMLG